MFKRKRKNGKSLNEANFEQIVYKFSPTQRQNNECVIFKSRNAVFDQYELVG